MGGRVIQLADDGEVKAADGWHLWTPETPCLAFGEGPWKRQVVIDGNTFFLETAASWRTSGEGSLTPVKPGRIFFCSGK